jgi:hypothetical protein
MIGEAIEALKNGIEQLGQKTSVNPQGNTVAPAPHNDIKVTSGQGIVHVALTDTSPRTRNVHNFVEWATTPNFSDAQTEHLGVGRQVRIPTFLGDKTPVYVRSYAMYSDGSRSSHTYYGSPTNPTPIKDGSAVVGPMPPPPTGSGTSGVPGEGFGAEKFVAEKTNPGKAPKVFAE